MQRMTITIIHRVPAELQMHSSAPRHPASAAANVHTVSVRDGSILRYLNVLSFIRLQNRISSGALPVPAGWVADKPGHWSRCRAPINHCQVLGLCRLLHPASASSPLKPARSHTSSFVAVWFSTTALLETVPFRIASPLIYYKHTCSTRACFTAVAIPDKSHDQEAILTAACTTFSKCECNKKLSCRRETARCFVSLNISSSHSRLFEMTFFTQKGVSPY